MKNEDRRLKYEDGASLPESRQIASQKSKIKNNNSSC